MPPIPSARRQRVGIELRKMRDAAGCTAAVASAVLGLDRSKVTLIEQGAYPISAERVTALAEAYEERDSDFVQALGVMAEWKDKGWWEEYRGSIPVGFLDIAEMEHWATGMQSYQICHVPGLMQTEEYSRAIFRDAQVPLTPRQVETRVEHRMRRCEEFLANSGRPYTAIVHEAGLRMSFGGRELLRVQLDRILELSHLPNVTLRVVGFSANGFSGSGQAIIYANGPVPRLDTVQYDSVDGPIYLHSDEYLEKYRQLIDRMTERALSVEGSRDLITRIKKEM